MGTATGNLLNINDQWGIGRYIVKIYVFVTISKIFL